ncbi:MAG TPA: branched-chain amino acid ABC transporter permease [Bacillota bacterium]
MIDYLPGFLTNVAIFAIFVLGLNLQFGFTGLLNFGHVAFLALGAYTLALLSANYGWPWWAALPVALVVSGLASFLIGLPALRLRDEYLAIVTIGFSEIVRLILNNARWTGGPRGVGGYADPLAALGLGPDGQRWALLLICLVALAAVYAVLRYIVATPWGRVLKAIREDEDAAIALGKDTRTFKLQALAIGAVIAGLAGVLMAFFFRYINPHMFMPLQTFVAWTIMVIGGAGHNLGVVIGAVLYFAVHSYTQQWAGGIPGLGLTGAQVGALRIIAIGVLLVLLMMYRPQGLFGRREELSLDR